MIGKSVHVVAEENHWAVQMRPGDVIDSRHMTQAAAIKAGRLLAHSEQVAFVVHGRDGRVRVQCDYHPAYSW